MRKIQLFILATLVMLAGCTEITDRLDDLELRVDDIENTQIATISQQITSINNSILLLNNTDEELKEYITTLETEAKLLEEKLTETNAKIDSIKNELSEAITTESANILAELEAFRATVNEELESIKTTLETLKAMDGALEMKIDILREYVDEQLASTEDWANATFATLEQYNEIITCIATIEGTIDGINESITALESRINEKIVSEIENASTIISADIQKAIENITQAYTEAITTASENITEAYTKALSKAISDTESSVKQWVNEQLTAYSTIAQTEAKITALQSEMDGKLAVQKTYLEALVNALSTSVTTDITAIKKQIEALDNAIAQNTKEIESLSEELTKQKEEITEAYTSAIAEAIASAKGEMSKELAEEIAAINERINQSDIAAIEALIANCKARLEGVEADIAQLKSEVLQLQMDVEELQELTEKLLAQIQSISYIPKYADGNATMYYTVSNGIIIAGNATLDFEMQPATTVRELVEVWERALSAKAVYTTITRAAGDFVNLDIESVTAQDGILSVVISGATLDEAFFRNEISANVRLQVSDGNNQRASEYVNMVPWTTINIPDANFKALLLESYDANGDGGISPDEAATITSLDVSATVPQIESLEGIEYFFNLTSLDCSYNKITSLNLASNTKLTTLSATTNQLDAVVMPSSITSLDLSNNQLSTIDVSGMTGLITLNVANNKLSTLNIRNNTALTNLNVSNNTEVSIVDVQYNTALKTLYAEGLSIGDISLLANNALTNVYLCNNKLLKTILIANHFTKRNNYLHFDMAGVEIYDSTGNSYGSPYIDGQYVPWFNGGVVYEITNDGVNGKMISVEETNASWYSAETWCSNYGTGWYLPSSDEMRDVRSNKSMIDSTLSAHAFTTLGIGDYWTSSDENLSSDSAMTINISGGYGGSRSKYYSYNVRAVLAF